jgi:hypothetical protein
MPTITVEDGSQVSGANSYQTVAQLRTYASDRGLTVPSSDTACEQLLVKAMDVLEVEFQGRYAGYKMSSSQPLSFPRAGVYIDSYQVGYDSIPSQLQEAQLVLAIEANSNELQPTDDNKGAILQETVGPLTVQYAQRGETIGPQRFKKAMALIKPLLRSTGFMVTRA